MSDPPNNTKAPSDPPNNTFSDPPNNTRDLPAPDEPYGQVAPLLQLAMDWLARSEGANVPLELAMYSLRWRGDWRLSIYRTPNEIKGVSIVMPRGDWFLEAQGSLDAAMFANTAAIHGRHPATLTTTERVSALIRPFLADNGVIESEHKVQVLKCTKPPRQARGRWATEADLPQLKKYESRIPADQRKLMDTAWPALIKRKELAVADDNNNILASIRRYGPAPSFAAIADLYEAPTRKPSNVSEELTGYVVGELLRQRKAVYVLVDEADTSSLTFFRELGFKDAETFYRADLK